MQKKNRNFKDESKQHQEKLSLWEQKNNELMEELNSGRLERKKYLEHIYKKPKLPMGAGQIVRGINFHSAEDQTDQNRAGYYSPKSRYIHIFPNADINPVRLFNHEATHGAFAERAVEQDNYRDINNDIDEIYKQQLSSLNPNDQRNPKEEFEKTLKISQDIMDPTGDFAGLYKANNFTFNPSNSLNELYPPKGDRHKPEEFSAFLAERVSEPIEPALFSGGSKGSTNWHNDYAKKIAHASVDNLIKKLDRSDLNKYPALKRSLNSKKLDLAPFATLSEYKSVLDRNQNSKRIRDVAPQRKAQGGHVRSQRDFLNLASHIMEALSLPKAVTYVVSETF